MNEKKLLRVLSHIRLLLTLLTGIGTVGLAFVLFPELYKWWIDTRYTLLVISGWVGGTALLLGFMIFWVHAVSKADTKRQGIAGPESLVNQ